MLFLHVEMAEEAWYLLHTHALKIQFSVRIAVATRGSEQLWIQETSSMQS